MYTLKIYFMWTSLQSRYLICGKGILSGLFYGRKAKRRLESEAKKEDYSKAVMELKEGAVIWELESTDLYKLQKEEAVFTEKNNKDLCGISKKLFKTESPLEYFEKMGIVIDFDYLKDGVKIEPTKREA